MSASIEALRLNVRELSTRLRIAEQLLKDAERAELPFKVGDVVLVAVYHGFDLHEWREAIVRTAEAGYGYPGQYKVSMRNKDGEWSKAVRDAYGRIKAVGA